MNSDRNIVLVTGSNGRIGSAVILAYGKRDRQ